MNLKQLTNGEKIIYEVIQLWNYKDKLEADAIESAILKGIKLASEQRGLKINSYPVFMPFRDSDEEDITDADKARKIFKADIVRLNQNTFGLIGFSDGLVKDAGAFFEYGRGITLRLPTLYIISDFFYFSNRYKDWQQFSKESITYFIDPIIQCSLGKLIINNDLPQPRCKLIPTSHFYNLQIKKKKQFGSRLRKGFEKLMNLIKKETCQFCLNPHNYVKPINKFINHNIRNYVYIDMEGICEWQIEKMNQIKILLDKYKIKAKLSQRFNPVKQNEYYKKYGSKAIQQLASDDLKMAINSKLIVTNGDGWDMPAGSAFIQGLASGLNIPVLLYYTSNRQLNAKGGTETLLNLMLEYSAYNIVSSTTDLINEIVDFWKKYPY